MLLWLWGCTGSSPDPDPEAPKPTSEESTPGPSVNALRVATWNVEGLGLPGSDEHAATREVLVRIDADVIGINEIVEGEEDALVALARELGYDVVQPRENPFGSSHNAMLTRLPAEVSSVPSSATLSADPNANDVTRWPVSVAVTAPWGEVVGVTVQHCKAGFDLGDAFRRSIDTHRLGQAATRIPADRHVALGDINEDLSEVTETPPSPARWSFPPGGLPFEFDLGDDIEQIMDGAGLENQPFALLLGFGFTTVDARQSDGREASRDSGRLIDYVLVGDGLRVLGSEIYDSQDEAFDNGLTKAGPPLERAVSRAASDHLPVVVDLLPE